jgi:hypothetical protein
MNRIRARRSKTRNSVFGKGISFLFCSVYIPDLGPIQPLNKRVSGSLSSHLKNLGRKAVSAIQSSSEVMNM